MDDFTELSNSETWKRLKFAMNAVFNIKSAMEFDGIPDRGEVFSARLALSDLENRLRLRYKSKYQEEK